MILFLVITFFSIYFTIHYDIIASGKASFVIIAFFLTSIIYAYYEHIFYITTYIICGFLAWGICFSVRFICSFVKHLYHKSYKIECAILFPEREKDLNRIIYYLKRENIIGIDANWGMGKTYILDKIVTSSQIKKEYDIVEIDVLTCNEEQLIPVLFHDLDKILKKNGILSLESDLIRTVFNRQIDIRTLINIFFDTPRGYAQQLEEFKRQLSLTSKKILIIYEDIDRIKDITAIKKILSINEKLSNGHIKVIYQYSQTRLDEMNLSRDYMEKFIPYFVELTPIPFKELIANILPELNVHHVSLYLNDFQTIYKNASKMHFLNDISSDIIPFPDWNKEFHPVYTPRNVKGFINDILLFMENYPIYNKQEEKLQLIRFMYLKHILPNYYNQIPKDGYISDRLKYVVNEDDNEQYSLQEALKKYISNRKKYHLFENNRNMRNFLILEFLGYKQNISSDLNERDKIFYMEHNLRLDFRYGNLRSGGRELLTLREKDISRIINEVLSIDDINERVNRWKDIFPYVDNKQSAYEELRPASNFTAVMTIFVSYDISIEQEKRFLELFFLKRYEPKYFDKEYIDTISLAHLEKPIIFDYVMEQTSRLHVKENYLTYNKFIDFLNIFSLALARQGYLITTPTNQRWTYYERKNMEDIDLSSPDYYEEQKKNIIIFFESIIKDINVFKQTFDENKKVKNMMLQVRQVCNIIINSVNQESIYKNGAHFSAISPNHIHINNSNKMYISELQRLYTTNKDEFWQQALKYRRDDILSWYDIQKVIHECQNR